LLSLVSFKNKSCVCALTFISLSHDHVFALATWAGWKQQSSLLLVMQPTLLCVVPEVRPENVAAFWSHGM
jgi:hypothetical protein